MFNFLKRKKTPPKEEAKKDDREIIYDLFASIFRDCESLFSSKEYQFGLDKGTYAELTSSLNKSLYGNAITSFINAINRNRGSFSEPDFQKLSSLVVKIEQIKKKGFNASKHDKVINLLKEFSENESGCKFQIDDSNRKNVYDFYIDHVWFLYKPYEDKVNYYAEQLSEKFSSQFTRRTMKSGVNAHFNGSEEMSTNNEGDEAFGKFEIFNQLIDQFLGQFLKSKPKIKGRNKAWKNNMQDIEITFSNKNFASFGLPDLKVRSGRILAEYDPCEEPYIKITSNMVMLLKNHVVLNETYKQEGLSYLESTLRKINDVINLNISADEGPMGRRYDLEKEIDWKAIENATLVAGQSLQIDTISASITYASPSNHTVMSRIVDIDHVIYFLPVFDEEDGGIYLEDPESVTGFTGFCNLRRAERTFSPERTLSMVITETGEVLEGAESIKEFLFKCLIE